MKIPLFTELLGFSELRISSTLSAIVYAYGASFTLTIHHTLYEAVLLLLSTDPPVYAVFPVLFLPDIPL